MTADADAEAEADEVDVDAAVPDEDTQDEGPLWFDGSVGWTTPKVVGLVLVVAAVVGVLAVVVADRMSGQSEDSADVAFMQDMIFHHEQAVRLGLIGANNAGDEVVRHFAQEVLVAQQWEVGYMTALLEEWGHGTGDLDRDAMAWMGMPVPVERMPGMISEDEVSEFRRMSGSDADEAFLRLMNEHHEGGIHMAEAAAERASDPRVRDLAERMAAKQRAEIAEYSFRAQRLGFEL